MEEGFQGEADLLSKLLTLYKIIQVWQKGKTKQILHRQKKLNKCATLCHYANFQYKVCRHLFCSKGKMTGASGSQIQQQENKHTRKN